jgi:hypothetical protein
MAQTTTKKIQFELNFKKLGFQLSFSYIFLDIRAESWFEVASLAYTEHPTIKKKDCILGFLVENLSSEHLLIMYEREQAVHCQLTSNICACDLLFRYFYIKYINILIL